MVFALHFGNPIESDSKLWSTHSSAASFKAMRRHRRPSTAAATRNSHSKYGVAYANYFHWVIRCSGVRQPMRISATRVLATGHQLTPFLNVTHFNCESTFTLLVLIHSGDLGVTPWPGSLQEDGDHALSDLVLTCIELILLLGLRIDIEHWRWFGSSAIVRLSGSDPVTSFPQREGKVTTWPPYAANFATRTVPNTSKKKKKNLVWVSESFKRICRQLNAHEREHFRCVTASIHWRRRLGLNKSIEHGIIDE